MSDFEEAVMGGSDHIRIVVGILVCLALPLTAGAQEAEYEHAAINYSQATPNNPVSRLQARIDGGEAVLSFDKQKGWLPSLLAELKVPQSSQMLVFSKTSLQRQRITPRRPRALYFNDDVYVGFCQNGEVLELSTADPQLGAVFYTVDQRGQDKPKIMRQTENCLICHASSAHTGGVPGHVVRSVFSDAGGFPVLSAGSYRIDQSSPIEQRWGGWYVTGTHGQQKHLGNLIVADKDHPEAVDKQAGMNVTDLASRVDVAPYLSAHSDIAALMVLEHQTGMHNRIAQAHYATRRAVWDEQVIDKAFNEPEDQLRDSTVRRIESAGETLVKYLLFSGEAPIKEKITGSSNFSQEFMAAGPRDSQGRSLRELDLERRVFKYPCSYLIYSDAFDALPDPMKQFVWRRLGQILSGQDTSSEYAHLSAADRQAIREILSETKSDLPPDWLAHAAPTCVPVSTAQ